MRLSEIVKGTDATRRIVKLRTDRTARRRADLLQKLDGCVTELRQMSSGVTASDDLELEVAVADVSSAVDRLKAVFGGVSSD